MRLLFVLLVACGSDPSTPDATTSDTCTVPTTYLGVEHDCRGGAGVCAADRGPVECFVKCATGGSVCTTGFHFSTQATATAEVCYCVPD
jgi:hypothetical protein